MISCAHVDPVRGYDISQQSSFRTGKSKIASPISQNFRGITTEPGFTSTNPFSLRKNLSNFPSLSKTGEYVIFIFNLRFALISSLSLLASPFLATVHCCTLILRLFVVMAGKGKLMIENMCAYSSSPSWSSKLSPRSDMWTGSSLQIW